MNTIPEKIFQQIVDIVYKESGIVLQDKRELLEARMASLSRKRGYGSVQEILDRLKSDNTGQAVVELLDQVSTNLTFFFREPAHFDFVSKVFLPQLMLRKKAQRNNQIRLWSAACSSGEEPYSLAITVKEQLGDDNSWDVKILATDISTKVLKKAIDGKYSRHEVMKAPPGTIQKYFERGGDRNSPVYSVRPEIKNMLVFRRLNLLQDSYPFSGKFDLIMCRNVMIYFDHATKQDLLKKFHRYMNDGGYLMTGHAESLTSFESIFKRIQVAVYQK